MEEDKPLTVEEVSELNRKNGYDDLYGGNDPLCVHEIKGGHGGGIECVKCPAWFCF